MLAPSLTRGGMARIPTVLPIALLALRQGLQAELRE